MNQAKAGRPKAIIKLPNKKSFCFADLQAANPKALVLTLRRFLYREINESIKETKTVNNNFRTGRNVKLYEKI